jgi:hypothetical protein
VPVVNCPAEQQPSAKTSAPEHLSSHSELRDLLGGKEHTHLASLESQLVRRHQGGGQHLLGEGVGEAARGNHG